jgi:hypothetical protein
MPSVLSQRILYAQRLAVFMGSEVGGTIAAPERSVVKKGEWQDAFRANRLFSFVPGQPEFRGYRDPVLDILLNDIPPALFRKDDPMASGVFEIVHSVRKPRLKKPVPQKLRFARRSMKQFGNIRVGNPLTLCRPQDFQKFFGILAGWPVKMG